jgi:hypothetical protein
MGPVTDDDSTSCTYRVSAIRYEVRVMGYHQVVGLLGVRSHTSKKVSRSWPDTSS